MKPDFNTFGPCLPFSPILPGFPSGPLKEEEEEQVNTFELKIVSQKIGG